MNKSKIDSNIQFSAKLKSLKYLKINLEVETKETLLEESEVYRANFMSTTFISKNKIEKNLSSSFLNKDIEYFLTNNSIIPIHIYIEFTNKNIKINVNKNSKIEDLINFIYNNHQEILKDFDNLFDIKLVNSINNKELLNEDFIYKNKNIIIFKKDYDLEKSLIISEYLNNHRKKRIYIKESKLSNKVPIFKLIIKNQKKKNKNEDILIDFFKKNWISINYIKYKKIQKIEIKNIKEINIGNFIELKFDDNNKKLFYKTLFIIKNDISLRFLKYIVNKKYS